MMTRDFFLNDCFEMRRLLNKIIKSIPCFTRGDMLEMSIYRFRISCREEDFGWVKKTLKKFTNIVQ